MHFAKSLMVAAGLLMAGTVAASARPAVATTDLNIRSGPGTRYAVIGSLPAGTQVNTGGCAGSWCRVGGGFVSASYLAFGGRAPARVVVQPNYYADDVAVGVGAFALGAAVGSAWGGPGWGYGPYWGPGPGYWGGPRYGYGPRYYGPRRGYWGGGPGWRGRGPVYYRGGVSGWRGGGADWRGRGRGPVFR